MVQPCLVSVEIFVEESFMSSNHDLHVEALRAVYAFEQTPTFNEKERGCIAFDRLLANFETSLL